MVWPKLVIKKIFQAAAYMSLGTSSEKATQFRTLPITCVGIYIYIYVYITLRQECDLSICNGIYIEFGLYT